MTPPESDDAAIIHAVRDWVENVVIDLDLCPFAKRELTAGRVRFAISSAATEIELLEALESQLDEMSSNSAVETSLLIHPYVLRDFVAYNDFLDMADALLQQMDLEGVFQIASFHPQYQFAETQPEDAENYTNRSPYPVLHILREESLERAIASAPDIDRIPQRNIETMNRIGIQSLRSLLQSCYRDNQQ